MSEPQLGNEATPDAVAAAPDPERRAWATRVISEVLQHMSLPGRIEAKDTADGGIAVALHFEEAVPGVAPGRRSHFVDSLQFLVNKIVNRPSTERRWVSIGVGDFPEPRQPRDRAAPRAPRPVAAMPVGVPAPSAPIAVARPAPAPRAARAPVAVASAPAQPDERSLQVPEDAAFEAAIRKVAESSAALGRFYAIAPISLENRARAMRAGAGIAGVKVDVEGEGRNRRVVFTPDKPAPMPKKAVPDYGDDDEDL